MRLQAELGRGWRFSLSGLQSLYPLFINSKGHFRYDNYELEVLFYQWSNHLSHENKNRGIKVIEPQIQYFMLLAFHANLEYVDIMRNIRNPGIRQILIAIILF